MMFLPKKSKKGITLVESVIAVVVLAIFASGVLTLLTTGGTLIAKNTREAEMHTEATQKLDMIIASISNGSTQYINEVDVSGNVTVDLDVSAINTATGGEITRTLDTYDGSSNASPANVRGWYLELKYNGVTVTGFASYTKGVFDS